MMVIMDDIVQDNRCSYCAIRHRSICGALSDNEVAELNRISRPRLLKAGQTIFADQEPEPYFANIISGAVKLTKSMPDGRQQIIGLQFPPDFVGRAYKIHSPFFAEAASDVELCCFPQHKFERLLEDNPDLEHRLFEHTLSELDAAREWMLLLGRKTAEERVCSFLTMIAKRSSNMGRSPVEIDGVCRFSLPLTRTDIADYLGLTIETVSRHLTKLKSKGLIQFLSNREVMVPDLELLAKRAQQNYSPPI